MSQVQLIARHTIAAGNEDAVFSVLDNLVTAARTDPGNIAFDVYYKNDDPRSYVLLERYASRGALAAHRDTMHFKDYVLGRIAPMLESRIVEECDAVD